MLNYVQKWSQSEKSQQISSKLSSEAELAVMQAVMSRAEKAQDIQNVVCFLDWDFFEQFERIILYRLCLLSSPENDTVEYNDKLSIAEMRQNKARLSPGPAVHMGTVGVFPKHFLKKSV